MSEPVCHYGCGRPLDFSDGSVLQAVWGWERIGGKRLSGAQAGSDIRYRQKFERFAHKGCVELERRGISAKQGALV